MAHPINVSSSVSDTLRMLALVRLMIVSNTWLIKTVLPKGCARSEKLSHDVETRLTLLKSMQGHCVDFLDQAEAALDVGTEQMIEIAADIFGQTTTALAIMGDLLDSDNDAAAFNCGLAFEEAVYEESGTHSQEAYLHVMVLILSHNLQWCANIMFLAHKTLVGEEAAARTYCSDDEEDQTPLPDLSYSDLSVLHQGAYGLRFMLRKMMSQLRADNKNIKRSNYFKNLAKSVDLILTIDLPVFIRTSEQCTIFKEIWHKNTQTRHDWIEAYLSRCADLVFQLDDLKTSGKTPASAEATLDLVLTCLQAWIAAAEKHQTEKTVADK